jgi:hypothetical protein
MERQSFIVLTLPMSEVHNHRGFEKYLEKSGICLIKGVEKEKDTSYLVACLCRGID